MSGIIAPSLLSADFGILGQEAQRMLDAGADTLHVDVMDGHFVPNMSFGIPAVKAVKKHTKDYISKIIVDGKEVERTGAFLDCHLMVTNPKQWLPIFHSIGVHGFTFHYEAMNNDTECIELLKEIQSLGIRSGIALKPGTSADVVSSSIAQHADMILVMTVEPGFGGQSFMGDMMPKVQQLRALYPTKLIQVDGGIDVNTISIVANAGANVIVSGSGVFGASSPSDAIKIMRDVVNEAEKKW